MKRNWHPSTLLSKKCDEEGTFHKKISTTEGCKNLFNFLLELSLDKGKKKRNNQETSCNISKFSPIKCFFAPFTCLLADYRNSLDGKFCSFTLGNLNFHFTLKTN